MASLHRQDRNLFKFPRSPSNCQMSSKPTVSVVITKHLVTFYRSNYLLVRINCNNYLFFFCLKKKRVEHVFSAFLVSCLARLICLLLCLYKPCLCNCFFGFEAIYFVACLLSFHQYHVTLMLSGFSIIGEAVVSGNYKWIFSDTWHVLNQINPEDNRDLLQV